MRSNSLEFPGPGRSVFQSQTRSPPVGRSPGRGHLPRLRDPTHPTFPSRLGDPPTGSRLPDGSAPKSSCSVPGTSDHANPGQTGTLQGALHGLEGLSEERRTGQPSAPGRGVPSWIDALFRRKGRGGPYLPAMRCRITLSFFPIAIPAACSTAAFIPSRSVGCRSTTFFTGV